VLDILSCPGEVFLATPDVIRSTYHLKYKPT